MKRSLWMVARVLLLAGLSGVVFTHAVSAQSTQDVPTPFVTTVPININNFNYTAVTIPAGMRLVVDYVSVTGAAQSSSGGVQPIAILNTTVGGSPSNLFYFAPPQNTTVAGQYYMTQSTAIYADTLSVGPAFAGFTPDFMAFNVVLSGHLIAIPAATPILEQPLGLPPIHPGIVAPPPEPSGGAGKSTESPGSVMKK